MSNFGKLLRVLIPALLLLAIIIVVFREVAFFIHPLKWDALDCTMPWKYFISTCFADGVFPFWNPYQHLGYPFYGDAQSTLYYPITLAMTYFHGYSFKMQAVDYIFHVWTGAVGMYILGRTFKFHEIIAFILALAYAFSGFMVGNAQHIYWIVSAAWLPFVILFYVRMQAERKIWQALLLSFFLYLMISGGYPAFVIMLAYVFLVIFIVKGIKLLLKKQNKELWQYVLLHGVIFVFTVGISLLYLFSVLDNYDFASRADGLSLAQILFSPFSFESFISFILPLTTTKGFEVFGTDMSMANGYIGLFVFLFFILSLFTKKDARQRIIITISVICLIISVGERTYLREFLYHYIPFFDTFRFPSAFRLFAITGFILSAGFYLHGQISKYNAGRMLKHMLLVMVPAILILGFIVIDTSAARPDSFFGTLTQIKTGDFSLNIESLAFIQAAIALILTILFLVLFVVVKSLNGRLTLMVIFVLFDLGIATRLQAPYSVYSPELKVSELKAFADQHFVQSYPIPDMQTNVIHHSDTSSARRPGLWRNLNNYYGQISHGGFSSYVNRKIDLMEDSLSTIYQEALSHPPLYISDCVLPYSSMHPEDTIHPCDYADIIAAEGTGKELFENILFTPNRIEFDVKTEGEVLICYLQSFHKYWKAQINGKDAEIILVNHFHIGVLSKTGKNHVVFEFRPADFFWVLYLSIGTFVLWLLLFIYSKLKSI
jgi:hypothetical protein